MLCARLGSPLEAAIDCGSASREATESAAWAEAPSKTIQATSTLATSLHPRCGRVRFGWVLINFTAGSSLVALIFASHGQVEPCSLQPCGAGLEQGIVRWHRAASTLRSHRPVEPDFFEVSPAFPSFSCSACEVCASKCSAREIDAEIENQNRRVGVEARRVSQPGPLYRRGLFNRLLADSRILPLCSRAPDIRATAVQQPDRRDA